MRIAWIALGLALTTPALPVLSQSDPAGPPVYLHTAADPSDPGFMPRLAAGDRYAAYAHRLDLASAVALVVDAQDGSTIYSKNANNRVPIASITKLMTAMVVLDAGQSFNTNIRISKHDFDYLRGSSSRLGEGTVLTRKQLLLLALMSSENRAASALARNYPGGTNACVDAMNRKARQLGMRDTYFADPTGLDGGNKSTALDLAKMVKASYRYPLIRQNTTTQDYQLVTGRGAPLLYRNTNRLVKQPEWKIGVSKTGYINEAGRCLVMQAQILGRPTIIVLLKAQGKLTGVGDANRIKQWLESIPQTGKSVG